MLCDSCLQEMVRNLKKKKKRFSFDSPSYFSDHWSQLLEEGLTCISFRLFSIHLVFLTVEIQYQGQYG